MEKAMSKFDRLILVLNIFKLALFVKGQFIILVQFNNLFILKLSHTMYILNLRLLMVIVNCLNN